MKASTKAEKRLVKIDASIRPLTDREKNWIYDKAFFHKCRLLKSKKASCLDCGHEWKMDGETWHNQILDTYCPSCKTKLEITIGRTVNFTDRNFVLFIQTHKKHQVVRGFEVFARFRAGEPAKRYICERHRFYIDENNNQFVISASRTTTWAGDRWGSDMSLKPRSSIDRYYRSTKLIYPRINVLKRIKRNGFNGDFHDWHAHYFFYTILNYPIAETLLKLKRKDFFNYYLDNIKKNTVEQYWSAIKLCIKHKYKIGYKNMSVYFDYMNDLTTHNKDFSNVKYACPKNLIKEHNKYLEKVRKRRLKEKVKDLKEKLDEHNKLYLKAKKRFFKLKFESSNISITPFYSVKQVLEESDYLRHCAFTNSYHLESDSLLLSAKVNNVIVETIEVDIRNFKLKQTRGLGNEPTRFSNKIRKIVTNNMLEIKKAALIKSKPKRKLKHQKVA